jgi:hypothetical protein
MTYLLQALCEMAVAQARHDWKQIKGIVRWCDTHYMEVSLAIVGLPLLGLIALELICWAMLREQNAQLAELALRFR